MTTRKTSLKKIGALWSARPGTAAVFTGRIVVRGYEQRFFIVANKNKGPGGAYHLPDFVLLTSSDPEPDPREPQRT